MIYYTRTDELYNLINLINSIDSYETFLYWFLEIDTMIRLCSTAIIC